METVNEAQKSRWWYRDVIRAFQGNKDNLKKMGLGVVMQRPSVGSMYCYYYDPKLKETLPLYDIFPLTIPIEYYEDGFLGLNLHYLPPATRQQFFKMIKYYRSGGIKINKNSSLSISYPILKNTAKMNPLMKQCIKRYLYNHIQSPFLEINPEQWDMVVPLPLQSFKKGRPW